MITVGILLPRSTYYAGISFDMFEGFQASLRAAGRMDIKVVTENIGFGTDKQLCYKAAEQLLMHADAQVVFAYVSHRTAQLLRPLFTAANRLLIVLDSGANIPHEWPDSPHIFYHSLHNSLGAWLMAKRAVADGYRQAGVATGYYDGGYLQTYAAFTGLGTSGGSIAFNVATGYTREDFSMQPLAEALKNYPDSCTFGIFSGDYVQWFFRELMDRVDTKDRPVYLPPFALEEGMLEETVYPGHPLKGVACWSRTLDNDTNRAFTAALEQAGRNANLFSLMGWEAGTLAVLLNDLLAEHRNNAREVSKALHTVRFESPRGTVRFHETLNNTLAPLYHARITDNGTGNCALLIEEVIPDTETAFNELTAQPTENAVSGWYNSYTCI